MDINQEVCSQWNDLISFKIKETDLVIPNETFLTNALIHYLQQFGFSVANLAQGQHNDSSDVRHKFKVELCTYIDQLYKLGNETSHSFCYYDLIRPTPKKTAHLLKYLLNYLLFFKKMKSEVLGETQPKIKETKEFESKIKMAKKELEKANAEEKRIEEQIKKYTHDLPKQSVILEDLTSKERDYQETKKRLAFITENHDSRLLELKLQEVQLRSTIVTNEEAENIFKKKETIEKALEEQLEIEKITKENNRDRKLTISTLEESIKKMESGVKMCTLDSVEKVNTLLRDNQELKEQVSTNVNKNVETKAIIEKKSMEFKKLRNISKEKSSNLKIFNEKQKETRNAIEKKIASDEQDTEHIDLQLHNIEDDLAEQEDIEITMKTSAKEIFKFLAEREKIYD